MSPTNRPSAGLDIGGTRYVDRITRAYVNEGLSLLGEGVAAQAIESAATESAGMAKGPLALLDELSLEEADRLLHAARGDHAHGHGHDHDHEHDHDHGHAHGNDHEHGHAHAAGHEHEHEHKPQHTHDAPLDHDHSQSARCHGMTDEAVYVIEKMAHGYGRMGRQAGRGFYDYDDEAPALWPGLKAFERRRLSIPPDDLRDRLLFVQVLESLRCLREGIVTSTDAADESAIRDCGYPASSGGPFAFANRSVTANFTPRARELASRYGERFEPPPGSFEQPRPGQNPEDVSR